MARRLVVADASALIALAKIEHLRLLRAQYGTIIMGTVLEEEVITQGRRLRATGMALIEQALAEHWLRVVTLTAAERRHANKLSQDSGLDAGEAEALSIAKSRKLRVIFDDKEARHAAATLGVSYIGTIGILLEAHQDGRLTQSDVEDAITKLTMILWLSPSVVAQALKIVRGNQ